MIAPSERLGLSRVEAAEYVGVGVTLFDQMVVDGRMPPPRQVNSRTIWSRKELERYFDKPPYSTKVVQTRQSTQEWEIA